ncbi:MAG: THUMP domain-containing protein [Tannerellaceae bacterium]|jgi:putative N6-adenine-specific DNA methylase|nr:THUMP domain-containing protein [Tannerellaceae bacterium]
MSFEMVAKTLQGLEGVLAAELRDLGAEEVQEGCRSVSFKGDMTILYKANFHCRTALRVLRPLLRFNVENADTIYAVLVKFEWAKYMRATTSFTVDTVSHSSLVTNSRFASYRVKDAIADYWKGKCGQRPSVNVESPDLYIHLHVSGDEATLSLDSSGESLHKRGYRVAATDTPLNEVLAAGLILFTGWRGECHLVDPMCGSGTFLTEAAMIALNIPPGLFRKSFAFEKWLDFDADLFAAISEDDSGEQAFDFCCYGYDISAEAVAVTKRNVESAGLSQYIKVCRRPLQLFADPPHPAMLVTNPPYGERLKVRDLTELYGLLGERLKHHFIGGKAWILGYRDDCFTHIGLHPSKKLRVLNGQLECQFRGYEMFAGTNKEHKTLMAHSVGAI